MSKREILLVSGFGRSGTNGIIDILRFHSDVFTLPYECRIITDPDGLISLKSALVDNWTPWQADFALHRFENMVFNLNKKFGKYVFSNYRASLGDGFFEAKTKLFNTMGFVKYPGVWAGNSTILKSVIFKFIKKQNLSFNNKIYFVPPINRDMFIKYSSNFILDAFENVKENKILLNEPYTVLNSVSSLKLSGANKIIISIRDPREIMYSFLDRHWSPRKLEQMIFFVKSVYNRWFSSKVFLNSASYLEIKFEDLIINSKETLERLSVFLNIDIDEEFVKKSAFSITKAHQNRWKNYFTKREIQKINTEFKEILTIYGYEH